jgi:SAM-dependent methyltransferase
MTEHLATRRSYDTVAATYAAEIGDELRHKPLDRALLHMISELGAGGIVLDLGCGPGHVAAYLAERSLSVGVDLSEAMAALAWRTRRVPACTGDLTALPIRTESVAAIACLYVIIHLDGQDRDAAYRELARVLQPGGHALIGFHVSDADHEAGEAITQREWWGKPVELIFRFLNPDTEITALSRAGFELVAQVHRAPYPGGEYPSQRCYLLMRKPSL